MRSVTLLGCDVSTVVRSEKGYTKPSQYVVDLMAIFERASEDPRILGDLRDLSQPPAVLWFILDRVYRSRLR
jgi:hypothetical protein